MKKLLVLAIFLNGMFSFAQENTYRTAIGLRAGETSGLTIKQFVSGSTAFERILGLEYKIPRAPVAFSMDLKPFIELQTRGVAWFSLDPGLGIKVAL